MSARFWERVRANGLQVPADRPLPDLTSELTAMLGDPDPAVREEIALPTLLAWVADGVYDELLEGLGDGMAAGLRPGLGEDGTDSVFRRTCSARVLTACLERDAAERLVGEATVLGWGDRLAGWWVREHDLRGPVPGRGWAHAGATGADALAALAASAHLGALELTVLLDVLADRLLVSTEHLLVHGEPDRMARAALVVLRRGLVELDVVEPWLARLAQHAAGAAPPLRAPAPAELNTQAFLRSLYLQLALAPDPPPGRADLLLTVIDRLRDTNPAILTTPG